MYVCVCARVRVRACVCGIHDLAYPSLGKSAIKNFYWWFDDKK